MSKMGLHDPFEYLKHKLWQRKRPQVTMPIWFPTPKSWESLWNMCVWVVWHISLESSWWELQFFSDLTLIKGLHNKLWASKVSEVLISRILGLSTQEPRKNDFWMQPLWLIMENTIMRKVVVLFKFRPWWVLWIRACAWLIHAPSMH
jgi:hypothetical protein